MPNAPFGISVIMRNIDDFKKNLGNVDEVLEAAMLRHLRWATPFMEKQVKRLATNKLIKRRTGKYVSSVRHRINERQMRGIVGTAYVPARQLELGGTIRPKRAKYLTIPLAGAKTRAGVSKKPRDYTGTFFQEVGGALYLFGKRTPAAKKAVPLFVLVKQVEQKGKHIFGTAFTKNERRIRVQADRRVAGALREAFKKGNS